jgi:hypothetical protein
MSPTQLTLAQVQDTDCILSFSPLVFGRRPGIYRVGAQAILARCLYAAMIPRGGIVYDPTFGCGILLLQGAALDGRALTGLSNAVTNAWAAEDFVSSASCVFTLVTGVLANKGARILLSNGGSYPLEVSLSSAGPALDALGS